MPELSNEAGKDSRSSQLKTKAVLTRSSQDQGKKKVPIKWAMKMVHFFEEHTLEDV